MSNLEFEYVANCNQKLRDFLLEKGISRKTLTKIKFENTGFIKVNGKEENVRYFLKKSDRVKIALPREYFKPHIRYFYDDINIIYEDKYFLVVNKPPYIATIPSRDENEKSLLEEINGYFLNKKYSTIPHVVTRLDKNTSGLVIIAKHRHIHSLFSKIAIDKYYLALAIKKAPTKKIIEAKIARKKDSIIEREVSPLGKYAKTSLERIKYYEDKDFSLVKLKLYTGRTHQIRVHLSHIGHNILGDELYGGDLKLIKRQALHCYNLIFPHPINKEILNIKIDIPKDMKKITKYAPK